MSRPREDRGEETALVRRAQSGDRDAYAQLVYLHQGVAFRVACLVAGNPADAEDAAQEAFVKAWYALDRFRAGEPLRPWLLRIVANEARNRRRSAARQAGLALRAASVGRPGDAAPSPEAALLGEERRAELFSALNALSETDRTVLALRFVLDLSEREAAAALGCRLGTVKSRTARALGRLRKELG